MKQFKSTGQAQRFLSAHDQNQLGKAAKLRTGTRFSTDSPPVLGIPMLDIVSGWFSDWAERSSMGFVPEN
jgi:hypothetical protein